ncbi:hypothetical protein ACHQM5_003668 [Ranunculus cassubicifolius]
MREDNVRWDGVPSDELRCCRTDGKMWQCKLTRLRGSRYCKKHDKGKAKIDEQARFEENRRTKKKESLVEEEDEIRNKKQKRDHNQDSESKEGEKCNITELLSLIKTVFRDKEFELVEQIFKMREENMKMKTEEAEKSVRDLEEALAFYEIKWAEISHELEEKKKDIIEVERRFTELELEKNGFAEKLQKSEQMCKKLKERVSCLLEDLEISCQRERVSQERIKSLGFAKTSAENEMEVWKERFRMLESRVLLERQGSWKERNESDSVVKVKIKEDRLNSNEHPFFVSNCVNFSKVKIEDNRDERVSKGCLSQKKIKEEDFSYGSREYASYSIFQPETGKKKGTVIESPPSFLKTRNSTAENDGISEFLSELRRLNADKLKGKGLHF